MIASIATSRKNVNMEYYSKSWNVSDCNKTLT